MGEGLISDRLERVYNVKTTCRNHKYTMYDLSTGSTNFIHKVLAFIISVSYNYICKLIERGTMTIKVKYKASTNLVPVTFNDDCNHAGAVNYITIEHNADTFSDGNIYPYYDEEEVLQCNNCGMYFNNTLGCWDVL